MDEATSLPNVLLSFQGACLGTANSTSGFDKAGFQHDLNIIFVSSRDYISSKIMISISKRSV
jgi:hypothetical protein